MLVLMPPNRPTGTALWCGHAEGIVQAVIVAIAAASAAAVDPVAVQTERVRTSTSDSVMGCVVRRRREIDANAVAGQAGRVIGGGGGAVDLGGSRRCRRHTMTQL